MTTPSNKLVQGDIAITRFPGVQNVPTPSGGTRLKGVLLEPHPVIVLGVDPARKEATVMLLGSAKEGNGASNLGLSPQEQKFAKLDAPSVYKPNSIAVVPLENVRPNGGHLPEHTMERVGASLQRSLGQSTVVTTHLARDGEITKHTIGSSRKGEVLLESPAKTAAARDVALESASKLQSVERAASEVKTVHRTSELVEIGKEVAQIAGRQAGKLAGGPVGDAYAVMDVSMALAGLVDKHTGHSLTEGPLGKAVAYAGEHSGAFHAVMVGQEKAQPYIDKAHEVADPYLAKAGHAIDVAADRTGLTTAMNAVGHATDKAMDWSGQQLASVQKLYNDTMSSAGHNVQPLDAFEAKLLANELRNVKPGDALIVDKHGSVELHADGVKTAVAEKGSIMLDAHAFKERAGLAQPEHAQVRVAER